MQLGFHGGQCCGIKVIHGLGDSPDYVFGSLEAKTFDDADACGRHVSSSQRFFHLEAPKESGRDRLRRYIDYIKAYRPRQIIEITLADRPDDPSWGPEQSKRWAPVLLEFGFRKVNENENSNSGNTVSIWHLNINEDGDGIEEDEADEADEGELWS